jgi:SepF-like predicted cell division protein (DUF552 family)
MSASTHVNRLAAIADELRSIAVELGWQYSELINCVGIINATRMRIAKEAGKK